MTVMAAKILLSPLCVVGVSLAGRRWGMGVAGVLGVLPVVAGPILLVETLLHGPAFGADAAAGTLLALAVLTAFVVVYGRAAGKVGAIACALCGWSACALRVLRVQSQFVNVGHGETLPDRGMRSGIEAQVVLVAFWLNGIRPNHAFVRSHFC